MANAVTTIRTLTMNNGKVEYVGIDDVSAEQGE
jgi:hypothetical protein